LVWIDTSRISLGSGWNPVPAASCTLLTLEAYSHELHVSLPCSGFCCSVAILAIPRGEEFWFGLTQAVFHSDRDGIPFLRRPARCSRWQLTPMSCMCRCRARGSAARSQSWRFCSTPCDGAEHFAGVVCMISWLRGAGRRRPACQYAPRSCMRVFAAWDGAAKPATLRSLVGGPAGGDVSGRQLSGLAIGFSVQSFSACTRRVRPRNSITRLSCTIMRQCRRAGQEA